MKPWLLSLTLGMFCSCALANGPSQEIIQKLSQIKNPKPAFNIELWTNRAVYRTGDPVEFHFRTDKDCYLTLIDVATEGVVRVVFPNKYTPDNFVKAGKTYNIPADYNFQITVDGPSGTEHVKAIATTRRMEAFDISDYEFFQTEPDYEDIVRFLDGLSAKLEKQEEWADTSLKFEIKQTQSTEKRALRENEGRPVPKPTPTTSTINHNMTRGLKENKDRRPPKPITGTGTVEHE